MERIKVCLLPLILTACTATPAQEAAQQAPLRIASLNPCSDAILAEVADPAQIAGLSSYSSDPASSSMDIATARRFAALGDSVEEVAAVRPDLVLTTNFMAPASARALERMGMRLERVGMAPSVADSYAQIRQIARIAGHPERGEALVRRIEAALAAAAPPPDAQPIPALVWQSGGMVPGQDTMISQLLARTGFANVAGDMGLKQADLLPLERVLARPPQVILTAGNLHGNEDRLLRHPALASLTGTARARLDPSLLWCGGPTIVRAAERLAEVRRAMTRTTPQSPPLKRRGSISEAPSSSEEGVGGGGRPHNILGAAR
ncbi:ABC transporter substrate-binding protein [Novosphingobium sp. B 225]|uniref:ABC transporter substrate-binding protein n=1 Tax=Novosphingobium sp. B 225 TaxID=1961849 RepID=UPI000B4B1697|nr:ABC transporter substrate-binding protein [Novosphingobium sp. B 225]